jgi:hypothetical protein
LVDDLHTLVGVLALPVNLYIENWPLLLPSYEF